MMLFAFGGSYAHRVHARVVIMLACAVLVGSQHGHAAAQTCVAPPPDMIAWWPGDGNANEIIAGRNGTPVNGATFAAGMVGQAFSFNGNSWIDVADDPIWTLGSHEFTIDLWVRFNALSGRDPFVGHDDSGGEFNKWIFWYDASGHRAPGGPALRFHINSPTLGPLDPIVYPWVPTLDQWYHVAITRSGTTYALYIDGVQVITEQDAHVLPDPAVPLTIGAAEAYRLNGLVDELEIFNRALAPNEIQAIYAAGSAGKCKGPIEICNDGVDNDGDALVDHDDPDCHVCGDSNLDPGEQCDDGNLTNGDGCSSDCLLSTCGDGIVDSGEQCDDGNNLECDPIHPQKPLDSCNNQCQRLICRDPGRIKTAVGFDMLKFHGRMVPLDDGTIPFDDAVAINLVAGDKIAFEARVPAGVVESRPNGAYRYRDGGAESESGVFALKARPRDGVYLVTAIAYGELRDAAPDMATVVTVGGRRWTLEGEWRRVRAGWTLKSH